MDTRYLVRIGNKQIAYDKRMKMEPQLSGTEKYIESQVIRKMQGELSHLNGRFLEIGRDFDVCVQDWSGDRKYIRMRKLLPPRLIEPLDFLEIENKITGYNRKYPEYGYYVKKIIGRLGNTFTIFWEISRRSVRTLAIKFYYCPGTKKFYLWGNDVVNRPKLSAMAVPYRFRMLGIRPRYKQLKKEEYEL